MFSWEIVVTPDKHCANPKQGEDDKKEGFHYEQNNYVRLTVVQMKSVFGPKPLF